MDIPPELADLAKDLLMPAGALGIATGLVRGAKALEKDANEEALKYVSKLLLRREIGQIGSVSATWIPIVFDKIFGAKAFSIKFFLRSVTATIIFWLILLIAKHPDFNHVWNAAGVFQYKVFFLTLAVWFIIDWMSLAKAKYLLRLLSARYAVLSALTFFLLDLFISYTLILIMLLSILRLLSLSQYRLVRKLIMKALKIIFTY
jgi:hypothetical protein